MAASSATQKHDDETAGARRKPRGTAKDRALRLLAVRWRSREELRRRLVAAGFASEEVETALEDLARVELVDDSRFARELVKQRGGRRMAGDREIRAALRRSGVSGDVAEQAMAGVSDEGERALTLARGRAIRMTGMDSETAYRRLFGFLMRRGYGPVLARDACRAAVAEVLNEPLHEDTD
jgi:regulatory protein